MKKILIGSVVVLVLLASFFALNQEEGLEDNVCSKDADCVLGVFCGCHTQEYIDKKIERYSEQGIAIDECRHPKGAKCVCKDGECEMIIEREEDDSLVSNNSGVEGLENLLTYKSEGEDSDDPYVVKKFSVKVNTDLFKEDVFNLNLPGEINLILETEEIVHCEDDPSLPESFCLEDHYTWWGEARGEDFGGGVFFVVIEGDVGGSISPGQIPSFSTDYSYTLAGETLIVK